MVDWRVYSPSPVTSPVTVTGQYAAGETSWQPGDAAPAGERHFCQGKLKKNKNTYKQKTVINLQGIS